MTSRSSNRGSAFGYHAMQGIKLGLGLVKKKYRPPPRFRRFWCENSVIPPSESDVLCASAPGARPQQKLGLIHRIVHRRVIRIARAMPCMFLQQNPACCPTCKQYCCSALLTGLRRSLSLPLPSQQIHSQLVLFYRAPQHRGEGGPRMLSAKQST